MLLLVETDAISKEKYYKKYAVAFFYSGSGKIVFALLTKVIVGYVVIISINVRKTCF